MTLKTKIIIGVVLFILIVGAGYSAQKVHIPKTSKTSFETENQTETTASQNEMGEIVYKGKFMIPVENFIKVTSKFGGRIDPITGARSSHSGIDLVGKVGSNVMCVLDGEVTWAGWQNSYGNCVEVKHTKEDGTIFYTFYAHMRNNSLRVTKGQKVVKGQIVGTQGTTGDSTGDHVHFEIRKADKTKIDPAPYLFEEI